jgi:hypothetical protein
MSAKSNSRAALAPFVPSVPSPVIRAAVRRTRVQVERECHPNDCTGNRLRAYVASVHPLRGSCYVEEVEAAQHRGRALIERLALNAERTDDLPARRLAPEEVADVLAFMAAQEPFEPAGWWTDEPADEPSHLCGFHLLLQALERSLRPASDAGASAEEARS